MKANLIAILILVAYKIVFGWKWISVFWLFMVCLFIIPAIIFVLCFIYELLKSLLTNVKFCKGM